MERGAGELGRRPGSMEVTMGFEYSEAAQVLSRTPSTLREMLSGLSEAWVNGDEGEGTFSPFEVVGHLVEAETSNWLPRARVIRAGDPSAAFPPFDRYAHRSLHSGKVLSELLDLFARLRAENLREVESWNLTGADLRATAQHPQFGSVTLGQLLSTWVVHDLGHLAQIARVMAKQYREAIGPWAEYLPVVNDRPRPTG